MTGMVATWLMIAASLVSTASAAAPAQADFSVDDADIANPERGFYRPVAGYLDQLTRDDAVDAFRHGYRLLYGRIDLSAYRHADLPANYIARLDAAFAIARQAGIKLIVRPVYNYPHGETDYHSAEDASLDRVLGHLRQLAPLFARNADTIAFVQAGLIGAWGEWHTSSNGLTAPANRERIRDALLAAVPASRFVQFRYPPYLQQWAQQLPPLASALRGSFRLGLHNDCFLASATDVGTFDADPGKRADQQAFVSRLDTLGPFGAETCNPADEPGAVSRSSCGDILLEGKRFALTYLNDAYYRPAFHDRWVAGGCMADVRKQMGYRFALRSIAHDATVRRGGDLHLRLTVENLGWARLYNQRRLEIVLRNDHTGATWRLVAPDVDPRAWLPSARTDIATSLALPVELGRGRYRVLVALPDPSARLRGDPRYSIRVANRDGTSASQRWDAALGAFGTGTEMRVE